MEIPTSKIGLHEIYCIEEGYLCQTQAQSSSGLLKKSICGVLPFRLPQRTSPVRLGALGAVALHLELFEQPKGGVQQAARRSAVNNGMGWSNQIVKPEGDAYE